MKRAWSVLFGLLLLAVSATVQAQTVQDYGYETNLDNTFTTIAQLLDVCDETRLAEAGHNVASHAGSMILAEIGKLRRGLDSLDNAARPAPILPVATARRMAKISPT